MPKSDLPFGSEFSPSQISLPKVLEFAQQHGGNWKNFEMAIRVAYFQSHKTSDYNKGKLANNTKLGMQAYGIIDDKASLTVFGKELFTLRKDEKRLYEALAKHILLNLHGSTLVQCVQYSGRRRPCNSEHAARMASRAWDCFPKGWKASKHHALVA